MRKEVRRNIFIAERNKFDNEPEMKNLIHNVSRRLGFPKNITLGIKNDKSIIMNYLHLILKRSLF